MSSSFHNSSESLRPHHLSSMLNINSPDIDLERDIIVLGMEEGELMNEMEEQNTGSENLNSNGISTQKNTTKSKGGTVDQRKKRKAGFHVNIATIIISGLLFLFILAWFDFIQSAFYAWCNPDLDVANFSSVPLTTKFWYALIATVLIFAIIALILYYNIDIFSIKN